MLITYKDFDLQISVITTQAGSYSQPKLLQQFDFSSSLVSNKPGVDLAFVSLHIQQQNQSFPVWGYALTGLVSGTAEPSL